MDPLTILLFIILFLLSAFFSGTELALMSLAKHKIDSLVKQNKFGSQSLKKIKENNDRLLITILIGNNLVNTFTAAFATSIAMGIASSGGFGLTETTAIGISTGIITFLLLLFGEIIPKSFAIKNAVSLGLFVAPIYKVLMILLYPVISFMEIIIKLFSGKNNVEKVSDEEIESFIDMGRDSGTLEKEEHEKIKNILEFDETDVAEIMTPRVKVEALSIDITVKKALDYYLSHTHSRIPVYTKTIDRIDYFITGRDLLFQLKAGKLGKKLSEIELSQVIKVPLNQPVSTLFETFQKAHKIMAIVMDEYGGVAGLVTMEDVIEEVFGEIRDETDKEVDEIKEISETTYLVKSRALIEDVLEKLGLELGNIGLDEKEFDGETVSFIMTHIVERFPKSGEVITFKIKKSAGVKFKKVEFKILDIIDHKIGEIEVKKI